MSMTKENQTEEMTGQVFCTSRYAISAEVTLQKFTLTPLSKARLHESAALHITNRSTTALT